MKQFTIYCTEEQTKKALELGAPIEVETIFASDYETSRDNKVHVSEHLAKSDPYQKYAIIPTAEQMICWLEEQKLIINIHNSGQSQIDGNNEYEYITNFPVKYYGIYISRKEAALAAIDAALEYLIKAKEK